MPRRSPWTPIFDPEPYAGAITVGNTPPGVAPFFGSISMLREFWAEDPAESYSDTDPITGWNDNGSLGINVSVVAGGVLWDATGINGLPAFDFTVGAAQYMRVLAPGGGPTIPYSMVVVVQLTTTTGTRVITDSNDAGQNAFISATAGNQWNAYNNGTLDIYGGTTDTDAHVLTVTTDDNNHRLYLDGTEIASDTSGTAVGPQGWTLGASYVGTFGFVGYMAYAAMYDGIITSNGDYAAWLDRIKTYYGIT